MRERHERVISRGHTRLRRYIGKVISLILARVNQEIKFHKQTV